MLFYTTNKLICDMAKAVGHLSAKEQEELEDIVLNTTDYNKIEIFASVNTAKTPHLSFSIEHVPEEHLTLLEKLTAEDENRLKVIKLNKVHNFLQKFAETVTKENRLQYNLWRAMTSTKSDIYFWPLQADKGLAVLVEESKTPFYLEDGSYFMNTFYAIKQEKEEKENKSMNIKPNMNFEFGPCGDGIAMSPYGLAIKSKDSWLTYNPATNQTVDVNGIVFQMKGMIYKIPVAITSIQAGDLIIHQNKAMYVTTVENTKIEAVDILASEAKTIIPVTNMFGFNYITKVVSIMDTNMVGTPSAEQPFGNIMPMLLMSQMFSDNTADNDGSIFGDDFMKMMMLSTMCGGANPFGAMFNFGQGQ